MSQPPLASVLQSCAGDSHKAIPIAKLVSPPSQGEVERHWSLTLGPTLPVAEACLVAVGNSGLLCPLEPLLAEVGTAALFKALKLELNSCSPAP